MQGGQQTCDREKEDSAEQHSPGWACRWEGSRRTSPRRGWSWVWKERAEFARWEKGKVARGRGRECVRQGVVKEDRRWGCECCYECVGASGARNQLVRTILYATFEPFLGACFVEAI